MPALVRQPCPWAPQLVRGLVPVPLVLVPVERLPVQASPLVLVLVVQALPLAQGPVQVLPLARELVQALEQPLVQQVRCQPRQCPR